MNCNKICLDSSIKDYLSTIKNLEIKVFEYFITKLEKWEKKKITFDQFVQLVNNESLIKIDVIIEKFQNQLHYLRFIDSVFETEIEPNEKNEYNVKDIIKELHRIIKYCKSKEYAKDLKEYTDLN